MVFPRRTRKICAPSHFTHFGIFGHLGGRGSTACSVSSVRPHFVHASFRGTPRRSSLVGL